MPQNAFDGNVSTLWGTTDKTSGYVGVQFSELRSIVEVAITARNDSYSAQTPESFVVQYSDDGETWSNSWSVATAPFGSGESRVFTNPDYVA